jgi:hypothetical protein
VPTAEQPAHSSSLARMFVRSAFVRVKTRRTHRRHE